MINIQLDTKCNAADIVIITIKLRGYGKNMTINEAGERYNITIHILKLYESWAWCRGSVKAELLLIFIEVCSLFRHVLICMLECSPGCPE